VAGILFLLPALMGLVSDALTAFPLAGFYLGEVRGDVRSSAAETGVFGECALAVNQAAGRRVRILAGNVEPDVYQVVFGPGGAAKDGHQPALRWVLAFVEPAPRLCLDCVQVGEAARPAGETFSPEPP
jgi:hypothetical protein